MTLIKCSECQKEISDQAVTCPNCGNSVKSRMSANEKVDLLKEQIKTIRKRKFEIIKAFFGF